MSVRRSSFPLSHVRFISRNVLLTIGISLALIVILNPTATWSQGEKIPYWHECFPTNASDSGQNMEVGDPISASAGEHHFTMNLFDLGGVLPLELRLYYGSVGTTKSFYGLPSRFLINQRLLVQANKITEPPSLFVEKGMGEEIGFHRTNNGWVAYDLEAIRYQLKETNDYYYLMDPIEELLYTFKKEYENDVMVIALVTTIQDRNGNTLTYEYPPDGGATGYDHIFGGPIGVTDGLGRELRFTYELLGTDPQRPYPYITRVEDQNGRAWTFQYEVPASDNPSVENGVALRSITDPLGNATTFRYADFDRITAVEKPAGNVPYVQMYNPAYPDRGVVSTQEDAYGNITRLSADEFESRTEVVDYKGTQVGMRIVSDESQFTTTYPDGTEQVYQHDHGSRVVKSITDQAGNQMTFQSDPVRHHITGVTDRLGDTTSITYHPATGKITSYTDAEGNTTAYTYEAQDRSFGPVTFTLCNLTRVTYPNGSHEDFAYDAKGNVTSYTDRAGKTWEYKYNAQGQVIKATIPTGGEVDYIYNADGTLASSTDSDVGVTAYSYDTCKRLNQITQPDGSTVGFTYDDTDLLLTVTDELGDTTTFTYDDNGNLITTTIPLSQTYTVAHDLMDRLAGRTDPLGQASTYTYDEMNRLKMITDRNGNTSTYGYDPRGWLTTVIDPLGHSWNIAYDDEGVPSAVTTPMGHAIAFRTDRLGRVTRATDPLGNHTDFAYDDMGRLTVSTDRVGRSIDYRYDDEGWLVGVTKPVIGTATYTRNDLGLLARITDLRGKNWDFGYSPMGILTAHTDPLDNQWTYVYDERGQLQQVTYPDATTATYTYDVTSQVTQVAYSGGPTLNYTYDEAGRLLTANNLKLTYDARGDVVDSRDGSASFGATYDDGRRLKTVTYDGQATVTYAYDERDLLTLVEDDISGAWIQLTYDADDRLTEIRRSNSVTTDFTYDDTGRVTRIQDGTLADQQYTLNAEGEPTQAVMDVPLGGGTITYTYDSAGRLTSADYGGDDRLTYVYDNAGNLLSCTGGTPMGPVAGTEMLIYNDASQINSPGYASDTRGRQTTAPGKAFVYDGVGRLTTLTAGDSTAELTYNGLGDLRSRTVDATTTTSYHNYALGLAPVVAEKVELSSPSGRGTGGKGYKRFYVYTPGGSLLYSIDPSNGDVRFYHFDRVGSTLFLTDETGDVSDAYAYEPYGRGLDHSGSSDQPFTFVGRYGVRHEPVGDLYDMRARAYDPTTARFLSRDPLWPVLADSQSLNPYQYATANPIRYIDPSGTQFDELCCLDNRDVLVDWHGIRFHEDKVIDKFVKLFVKCGTTRLSLVEPSWTWSSGGGQRRPSLDTYAFRIEVARNMKKVREAQRMAEDMISMHEEIMKVIHGPPPETPFARAERETEEHHQWMVRRASVEKTLNMLASAALELWIKRHPNEKAKIEDVKAMLHKGGNPQFILEVATGHRIVGKQGELFYLTKYTEYAAKTYFGNRHYGKKSLMFLHPQGGLRAAATRSHNIAWHNQPGYGGGY